MTKSKPDGKRLREQIEKVLADTLSLQADIERGIATAESDLGNAQTSLRNVESLARDKQYGKYYDGHVEYQRFLIAQLQKRIAASESRVAKLDQNTAKLLALRDKL